MNQRRPLPRELRGRPFTTAEARNAGVTDGRLLAGDLKRPFHGIRTTDTPSTIRDLCSAYAAAMPPDAFFSSTTAAQLMGVPLPRRLADQTELHVAVVSPHRAFEGRGTIGHKVQLMGGDWWIRNGLRLSTPERCWCELARLLSVPELVAAGDHLIHWRAPLTSIEQLAAAMSRFPDRRGRKNLLLSIGLLNDRAESPMESVLRVLLHAAGIEVEANYPVKIGSRSYRLDLAIAERRIAIEYQGDYHREKSQWRRDMTRISQLESVGWVVIQVNADDLRDPGALVERIRRVIAARPVR